MSDEIAVEIEVGDAFTASLEMDGADVTATLDDGGIPLALADARYLKLTDYDPTGLPPEMTAALEGTHGTPGASNRFVTETDPRLDESGPVTWNAVQEKPSEFPPTPHTHDFAALDNLPAAYPPSAHTHPWTEVTGKPATYPPDAHTHAYNTLTGTPSAFPPTAHATSHRTGGADPLTPADIGAAAASHTHAYNTLTGTPTSFAPSAHKTSHATGGGDALTPADIGAASASHTHAYNTLTGIPSAFPPSAHAHPVGEISASGTPSGSTFLRGDGTWATPPSGGGSGGPVEWTDVLNKPATFPPEAHTHSVATTSVAGFLAAADKLKLDGIATGATANTGTVTSVSVTAANGVSGTVTNASTTPAISLTLGAITPSSVAATGTVTGSNLSGTNTGDQTSVSGNAGTATTLQTARTIALSGKVTGTATSFNGSANITIPVTAVTLVEADIPTLSQSKVTNLTTDLASKAPLASPALTGTPTAPTAAVGTNTTQLATCAFVLANAGGGGGGGASGPMTTAFQRGAGPSLTTTEQTIGTVTIAVSSASAKVLILARVGLQKDTGTTARTATVRVRRGSANTDPQVGADSVSTSPGTASIAYGPGYVIGEDTPGVAGSVTYTVRGLVGAGASTTPFYELEAIELTGAKGDPGDPGPPGSIENATESDIADVAFYANGNLGSAATITWTSARRKQTGTLNANTTLTLAGIPDGGALELLLTTSGTSRTVTWAPESGRTLVHMSNGGTAPPIPSASGASVSVLVERIGTVLYLYHAGASA